jgi:hypothetical protein
MDITVSEAVYVKFVQLDWALMGHDMAHTRVNDAASFVRDNYTTHGLHLNSEGKRRLTHLTVERTGGGHVSNIPVVTSATASTFFSLKSKL